MSRPIGGHRAVLGHGGREPGFHGQLGQHAGRRDAVGEVVVGAEVVVVEKVHRESTAPPRIDARTVPPRTTMASDGIAGPRPPAWRALRPRRREPAMRRRRTPPVTSEMLARDIIALLRGRMACSSAVGVRPSRRHLARFLAGSVGSDLDLEPCERRADGLRDIQGQHRVDRDEAVGDERPGASIAALDVRFGEIHLGQES